MTPAKERKKASTITRWRLLIQACAFLLILVNPFLILHFHFTFIQGWYQSLGIGKLWIVSPLEGLESILVAKHLYPPLLVGMLIPVLLALFLGRVFCGWICPIHFLSDLSDRLVTAVAGKKRIRDRFILPRSIFWYSLMGELLLAMILGAPLFVFLSPPGLVGREIMNAVFFHTLAVEGVVVLLVLGMNLITRRFYCRYLCPLGALLALIGSKRRLNVRRNSNACVSCGLCDRACPLGLKPSIDEGNSVHCWNCGACVDACATNALSLEWHAPANILPELPVDHASGRSPEPEESNR